MRTDRPRRSKAGKGMSSHEADCGQTNTCENITVPWRSVITNRTFKRLKSNALKHCRASAILFVCLGHDLDSCILIRSVIIQKVAAFLLSCILIGLKCLEKKEASQILTIF